MYSRSKIDAVFNAARAGLEEYFSETSKAGRIDADQSLKARRDTLLNLESWLREERLDTLSPRLRETLISYVEQARWPDLVNAYRGELRFGTAGIRGLMAFER